MEKIDGRSCSTLAKTLGTIVSISGAFIVTLYKGPPLLMTASVDMLSHNQLFLPQSNWVIGGMLLGLHCVVAAAWLIIQVKFVKFAIFMKLQKSENYDYLQYLICISGISTKKIPSRAHYSLLLLLLCGYSICSGVVVCGERLKCLGLKL